MVTKKDNNKQENMVNNEHENHTEEYQEEGFLTKNKNMLLGIGALILIGLLTWAMFGNKKSDAEANASKSESKIVDRFKNWWNGGFVNGPLTRKEAAIAVGSAVAFFGLLKRTKWGKNGFNKTNIYFKEWKLGRLQKQQSKFAQDSGKYKEYTDKIEKIENAITDLKGKII